MSEIRPNIAERFSALKTRAERAFLRKPIEGAVQVGEARIKPVTEALDMFKKVVLQEKEQNQGLASESAVLAANATEARAADETGKKLETASGQVEEAKLITETNAGKKKKRLLRDVPSMMTSRPAVMAEVVAEVGQEAAKAYTGKVRTEVVDTTVAEIVTGQMVRVAEVSDEHNERIGNINTGKARRAVTGAETSRMRVDSDVAGFVNGSQNWAAVNELVKGGLTSEARQALKAREAVEIVLQEANLASTDWQDGMSEANDGTKKDTSTELAYHKITLADSADGQKMQTTVDNFASVNPDVKKQLEVNDELVEQVMRDPEATLDKDGNLVVAPEAEARIKQAIETQAEVKLAEHTQKRLDTAVAVVNFQGQIADGDLREPQDAETQVNMRLIAEAVGLELSDAAIQDPIQRKALVQTLSHMIGLTGNRIFEGFAADSRCSELAQQGYTFRSEDGTLKVQKDGQAEEIQSPASQLREPTLKSQQEALQIKVNLLKDVWEGKNGIPAIKDDTVGGKETWRKEMVNLAVRLETAGNPMDGVRKVAKSVLSIYDKQERVMASLLSGGEVPVMAVPATESVRREETTKLGETRRKIVSNVRDQLSSMTSLTERYFSDRNRIPTMVGDISRRIEETVPAVYKETTDDDAKLEEKQKTWGINVRTIISETVSGYIREKITSKLGKIKLD